MVLDSAGLGKYMDDEHYDVQNIMNETDQHNGIEFVAEHTDEKELYLVIENLDVNNQARLSVLMLPQP